MLVNLKKYILFTDLYRKICHKFREKICLQWVPIVRCSHKTTDVSRGTETYTYRTMKT